MRIILQASLLLVAFSSASTLLQAQEVSTTKSTRGIWDKVSSQSAIAELRHTATRKSRDEAGREDELKPSEVSTQLRGYFNLGLYKDRWNNTLILAATSKNDGNQQILQRRPELYSEITAVDSKFFTLKPYLDLYFPHKDAVAENEGTEGELGIIPQLQLKGLKAPFGAINLATRIEAEGQVSSRPKDAKVTNAKDEKVGPYLTSKSDPKAKDPDGLKDAKSDPTYEVIYVGELGLDFGNVVKGLSLTSWFEYTNDYTPAYTLDEDGTRNKTWVSDRYTWTWFVLAYKVNPLLTVSNTFGMNQDGFYQAKSTHESVYGRYTNRVALAYTLY